MNQPPSNVRDKVVRRQRFAAPRRLGFVFAMTGLGGVGRAQPTIPMRSIGPILAASTEDVGAGITVRATSDGHVIVASAARQRVYAFDSTLKTVTIVVDSESGTSSLPRRTIGVIPYLGDSTLLPDLGANVLLVVDAAGKQVRSMAPPRPQDLTYLGSSAAFGRPGLDAMGRLIYRIQMAATTRPEASPSGDQKVVMTPVNADSAPIVRGDFDTRRIDTLAWLSTPSQGRMGWETKANPGGGLPSITMHLLVNPFPMADQWSLLSDGTIAIVRTRDYHIDWVDPDGSRRSSPKMPTEWRRYTDEERRQRVDSVRRMFEEQSRRQVSQTPPGVPALKTNMRFVPDSEFPQFWPPVQAGSVLADLEGRLWILPTISSNAANGLAYDVVNRQGEIVERVQLPKNRVLVGFGPNNVVYLARAEGNSTYLERARLNIASK